MLCPFCGADSSIVKNSRSLETTIRRRRECQHCKQRFSTFEVINQTNTMVIKRSGTKKFFDKSKLISSIRRAMVKRSFSEEFIVNLANDIIKELKILNIPEIPSVKIGNAIMNRLANIDEVSYIRFASVYYEFRSIADFAQYINQMSSK